MRQLADHAWPKHDHLPFWIVLWVVMAMTVWLGANRPIPSMVLNYIAIGCLTFQTICGRTLTEPAWRKLRPAALLFFAVGVWGLVQALPIGLWAHPSYAALNIGEGAISADPWASGQGVTRMAAYASIFLIAAAQDRKTMCLAVDGVALFSGLMAIYALCALGFGVNPITGPTAYEGSATGSFVNRNAYAFHAGVGVMSCLAAIALNDGRQSRQAFLTLQNLRWLCLFVTVVALLQTGSRAGVASSLVGVVLVVSILHRKTLLPMAAVGFLSIATGVGAGLLERFALNPFLDQRITIYGRIVEGILDRPILGHGMGAFQDAFRSYVPSGFSGSDWDKAHNTFFEVIFEFGVPMGCACVLALVWLVFSIAKCLRSTQRMRPVLALALGASVSGGLHALVDFSLQMPASAALFAIMLGFAWGAAHPETVLSSRSTCL